MVILAKSFGWKLRRATSLIAAGLTAKYFVDSVQQIGGYPRRVWTDCDTENNTVTAGCDSVLGYRWYVCARIWYVTRQSANWSLVVFFGRYRSQWWIELFENLIDCGAFQPGSEKHVENDLDSVRHQWNTHRIRPSAGARCPAGIPDELFHFPQPPAVNCS